MVNDPNIIEHVTAHVPTFESVCAVLEHDPNTCRRADHLRFLWECTRFHTVVWMYDRYWLLCGSRGTLRRRLRLIVA